jgi:hypothetical protein
LKETVLPFSLLKINDLLSSCHTVSSWLPPFFPHNLNIPSIYTFYDLGQSLRTTHLTDCLSMLKMNRKEIPMKVKYTKLDNEGMTAENSSSASVINWTDKKHSQ